MINPVDNIAFWSFLVTNFKFAISSPHFWL
nr:MAG TPA: hypothetical protein [Caudoviricetes sp.]